MTAFWENRYRYVILFVGFFCLASQYSNYTVLNFTLICMKNDLSETRVENGTIIKSIYDYDSNEKKWIMWAVAAGTIIGTIPVNMLYVKFGAKYPFFIAGIVSAISTALIPLAARNSMMLLLFLRFLQGLAYSADFAAIGLMTVRWAPLKEIAFFMATLTCFNGISSMITNSVTGVICESSLGWKYSFYLHAIGGILLFILWFLIYVDDPKDTKRVSEKELYIINRSKSEAHLNKKTEIPYRKIFTSPVILIVWLNAFFEISAIIIFATYMPIYFHQVLEFGVKETGFYVAFALSFNIPFRIIASFLSDRITILSEKTKMLIFNTLSVGVSGVMFAVIGFIPKEERMFVFILIVVCMVFIAINCGGFYKCGALHSRQFAHIVISAIQFMKCLALFSAPAVVSIFVTDDSVRQQWIPVFICFGAAMFVINIISMFVFTDQPAEWTECDTKEIESSSS